MLIKHYLLFYILGFGLEFYEHIVVVFAGQQPLLFQPNRWFV